MPTWKKVVVSGSSAHLTSVTASTAVLVGTNQQITTNPSTTFLSGSFSGSFKGDGSGLSGIAASFPIVQTTNLASTNQFFVNDGASKYIVYSDLIADLAGTNLTSSDSGDSLALSPNINLTSITASVISASSGLTGSLFGTSSWAFSASNAINSQTSSYILASGVAGLSLNQIATGSVTASVNVGTGNVFTIASASITEFTVSGTGVNIGNVNTDNHRITGSLGISGSVTVDNNLTVNGTTITIPNIIGGTTDTVIIRDGANTLKTRAIDPRVWVTSTLISGSGTSGQVAFFSATSNGITGSTGFTFATSNNTLTVPNLTVTGTASFQETTNLAVTDKFILLNSGSNAPNEGGIVVQQATNGIGEVFGWDSDQLRWGVTSSFAAVSNSFSPDAFMAIAITGSSAVPPSIGTRYSSGGNIFIGTDQEIWIFS